MLASQPWIKKLDEAVQRWVILHQKVLGAVRNSIDEFCMSLNAIARMKNESNH
jgi:hypothetical protein